jgi:hypothetical protein
LAESWGIDATAAVGRHARNALPFFIVHLMKRRSAALCLFKEMVMPTRLKTFAIAAVLAAGTSGAAMAAYPCAPGYALYGGVCQPVTNPGYSNPVSGTVSGEASGAAQGYATGGPVGAVVGGALGAAGGAIAGTGNMLSGGAAPACAAGYYYYNGYCYPNR